VPPEIRRVSDAVRRSIFNTHYLPAFHQGTLREVIIVDKAVQRPWLKSGRGRRITSLLYDNGTRVAVCVYFRNADGSMAASRMPDPKWVFHDGVIYTE
jgi:hypothetical protein